MQHITNTKDLTIKENIIELQAVLEIEVEENRFLLPDKREIGFEILKTSQEVFIQFFKNNSAIFAITTHINVTIQELITKISEVKIEAIPQNLISVLAQILYFIITSKHW